jgi:hypothetical protein
LSGLKWVKIEKDARAPEDGDYIFRCDGGLGNTLLTGVSKGASLVSALATHYAGPVVIAEPEPELELPQGWEMRRRWGTTLTLTLIREAELCSSSCPGLLLRSNCYLPQRVRRILGAASKAAVKALEESGA